jgi:hypothetical protein
MFFRFPPDVRWNSERSIVEFGIGVREYEGVVRVSRRVFQILLPEAPTPERCLETYHLYRTRLASRSDIRMARLRIAVPMVGPRLRPARAASLMMRWPSIL